MDGFEVNKIFGALVGALGVYVALGIGVGALYAPPHHGDDHHLAYSLVTEETETETEQTEPEPEQPLPILLAAADASAGSRVWNACRSCHQIGDGAGNGIGPMLNDVLGRDIASVDGFAYSDALQGRDGAWTWEALNAFLENPAEWAPGTRMNYAGLRSPEDRANLMLWINEQASAPLELPAAETEEGAAEGAEGEQG